MKYNDYIQAIKVIDPDAQQHRDRIMMKCPCCGSTTFGMLLSDRNPETDKVEVNTVCHVCWEDMTPMLRAKYKKITNEDLPDREWKYFIDTDHIIPAKSIEELKREAELIDWSMNFDDTPKDEKNSKKAEEIKETKKEEKKDKEAIAGVPEDMLYEWAENKSGKRYPKEPVLDEWRQWIIDKYNVISINNVLYLYDEKSGAYTQDVGAKLLSTTIRDCLRQQFRKPFTIKQIVDLIRMDYGIVKYDDELNKQPDTWINFKNGMLDVVTGKMYPHAPEYLSTNQIPHNYVPGKKKEDSWLYKFVKTRVSAEDDLQMLFTFAGYCMLPKTRFRNFLVLTGPSHVGKSVLLNCIQRILGKQNISAVPLNKIGDRFATVAMYGKIANICGDLDPTPIKDSGMLKLATGCGDMLHAEYKGIDGFDFENRAKLIFSANKVPKFLNEETDAVFDRLLVVRYHDGPLFDYLNDRLKSEEEIETEISFMVEYLRQEIRRTKGGDEMTKSSNCLKEVDRVRSDSDTTHSFISEACTINATARTERSELYDAYVKHCSEYGREILGKVNFFTAMRNKGFQEIKSNGERYFRGIVVGSQEQAAEVGFMTVPEAM